MLRMKWSALSVAVLILSLGAFYFYRAVAKHRDLQETLAWMDQTYNPHEGGDNLGQGHGWEVHYVQKYDRSYEVTQKFRQTFASDGACKIVIHSETLPEGVYVDLPSVTTYTFNLCDIDPDSIKIETFDLRDDVFDCADPAAVKAHELTGDNAEVFFLVRNGATAINEEKVTTYMKLTGADHESKRRSKTNKSWLIVDDVPYAERLATALKHAVELCGGKASRF
jgi:hypothetical protein